MVLSENGVYSLPATLQTAILWSGNFNDWPMRIWRHSIFRHTNIGYVLHWYIYIWMGYWEILWSSYTLYSEIAWGWWFDLISEAKKLTPSAGWSKSPKNWPRFQCRSITISIQVGTLGNMVNNWIDFQKSFSIHLNEDIHWGGPHFSRWILQESSTISPYLRVTSLI